MLSYFPEHVNNVLVPTGTTSVRCLQDTADFLRKQLVKDHLRAPRIRAALAVIEADLADAENHQLREAGHRGKGWSA